MTREARQLAAMRKLEKQRDRYARAAATRARRRDERMAEAVENETIAERRERLLLQLDIANGLVWAEPQRVMLREGLAELPPVGSADAMTWAEFKAQRMETP